MYYKLQFFIFFLLKLSIINLDFEKKIGNLFFKTFHNNRAEGARKKPPRAFRAFMGTKSVFLDSPRVLTDPCMIRLKLSVKKNTRNPQS